MKGRLGWVLAASVLLPVIAGCAGGSVAGTGTTTSPAISSVSVVCAPSSISAGATSQCNAMVAGTGSYSSTVTWTASSGTINGNGLLTAPSSAAMVTVTATSAEDASKSGTATVMVATGTSPPTISSVSVTCNPSTVAPSATSQCKATVQGTGDFSSAVTWTANGGTINSSGLFTAPGSTGSVKVTATSTQDPSKSGTATITIATQSTPPTISSVSVSCSPSTIAPSATSQCSATVHGTGSYSSAVTWTASGGTISATGLFTAPGSAGSVMVTATSTQDTTKFGTATITLMAAPPTISSVGVVCSASTIATNATSQCTATVHGTGSFSSTVTWTASGGTIDSTGLFTAPSSTGSFMVTATSTEDTTKKGTATITVRAQTPHSQHVILVMEENRSYSSVVGQTTDWPNLNHLISTGALATNYYSNTHPSIGNYFMLTTGQILTNDDNSTTVWNVDNIARRMLSQGVSFRIYAEGITQGYVGGNTGLYLIRHNPFAMLSDIADDATVADAHIWPFSQFAIDLANGTLPEYSYIAPDVNDDAHNGTSLQADTWLQANVVDPLSTYSAFEPGGDGVLIVDFDEAADSDTTHGGGHIACVLWGPAVKSGYQQTSTTVYQHQSMLATQMELLGLTNPPGAAASAPLMNEFFVQK
ncbi:MAG: alkaline phosphatase family protein [Acidobacteriaceae bacterium]